MPSGTGPSRWSIDLEEQASLVEVLGGGALLTAAVLLAGLGIVRAFHGHPSGYWFFGALALAGVGLLVLVVSFTAGVVAHRARRPHWAGSVDTTMPGVLLFLLAPAPAMREPADAAGRLGPVRCQVSLAGESVVTASDDRISRVRGILMTRHHPAFFAGVPYLPASGTYHFQWDEEQDEGWHTLVAGSAEVVVRAPSADDPDWGRELAARVASAGEPPVGPQPEPSAVVEPAASPTGASEPEPPQPGEPPAGVSEPEAPPPHPAAEPATAPDEASEPAPAEPGAG
jgi:hypothetical protein